MHTFNTHFAHIYMVPRAPWASEKSGRRLPSEQPAAAMVAAAMVAAAFVSGPAAAVAPAAGIAPAEGMAARHGPGGTKGLMVGPMRALWGLVRALQGKIMCFGAVGRFLYVFGCFCWCQKVTIFSKSAFW